MLALLDKQEKERQQKLQEFHRRIESMTKAAGQTVVKEAQNQQEVEAQRLLKFQVCSLLPQHHQCFVKPGRVRI